MKAKATIFPWLTQKKIVFASSHQECFSFFKLAIETGFLPQARIELDEQIICPKSVYLSCPDKSTNPATMFLSLLILRFAFWFIPIRSLEQLKSDLEINLNTKIVPINLDPVYDIKFETFAPSDQFLQSATELDAHGLIEFVDHPILFTKDVRQSFDTWIVMGYPGSGNIIVQNICNQLKPLQQKRLSSNQIRTNIFCNVINKSFLRSMSISLYAELKNIKVRKIGHQRTNYKSSYIHTHPKGGIVNFISGIRACPDLEDGLVIGSHEPPSFEAIRYYKQKGLKIIVPIRHPLDVLVSLAAKFSRIEVGNDKSKMGHVIPEPFIDDEVWFSSTLNSITRYLTQTWTHKEHVYLFNYDKFQKSGGAYTQAFAQSLGINIDDIFLESLLHKFFNKPLDGTNLHFNHPSIGKWIGAIPKDHIELIEESGIIDAAAKFGFEIDTSQLTRSKQSSYQDFMQGKDSIIASDDDIFARDCELNIVCQKELDREDQPKFNIFSRSPLCVSTLSNKDFFDKFMSKPEFVVFQKHIG